MLLHLYTPAEEFQQEKETNYQVALLIFLCTEAPESRHLGHILLYFQ